MKRIAALDLQVGYYEALLANHEGAGASKVVDYLHERCRVADGRLQQAMMHLMKIRKMLPQSLHIDVVVSGEVHPTVSGNGDASRSDGKSPMRLSVPANRIEDLLAAAKN